MHLYVCYLDLLCILIPLQNSKKITLCSWSVFYCFVMLLHVKVDKKNICAFILHICVFLRFLMSFLHNCWSKFIPYNVDWHLIAWFYSLWFHDNTFDLSKVNPPLFLCNILNFVKTWILWYFAIFVKFDSWLQFCDISIFFVKFDSWLLFCDISFFLLKLILDINCVICCNLVSLVLDADFVLFCNLV